PTPPPPFPGAPRAGLFSVPLVPAVVAAVAETVDLMEARGTAMGDPDFVTGGKTVIAFIKDPDYYKFELLERAPKP
ncbi:unnamed protein product, partial [Musa textilis]